MFMNTHIIGFCSAKQYKWLKNMSKWEIFQEYTSQVVVSYNLIEYCAIVKDDNEYCIQPFVTLVISNSDNISEIYKMVDLLILWNNVFIWNYMDLNPNVQYEIKKSTTVLNIWRHTGNIVPIKPFDLDWKFWTINNEWILEHVEWKQWIVFWLLFLNIYHAWIICI